MAKTKSVRKKKSPWKVILIILVLGSIAELIKKDGRGFNFNLEM